MMQFIREHANSTFAKFLFLGIGISFLGFGGAGFFGQRGGGYVAKVNGEKIDQYQVQQEFTNMMRMFDASSLRDEDVRQIKLTALENIVTRTILRQKMNEWELNVSDQDIVAYILAQDYFIDETTGKFNPELYRQILAQQGINEQDYERSIRSSLTLQRLFEGVGKTVFVTDSMLNDYATIDKERRTMEIVKISFDAFRDQITITDDEVRAEFEQNGQAYQSQARAKIAYLELPNDYDANTISLSEEEIQSALIQAREEAAASETRSSDQLIIQFDNEDEKNSAEQELKALYEQLIAGTITFDEAKAKVEANKDGVYHQTGIIRKGGSDDLFNTQLFALSVEHPFSSPFVMDSAVHLIRLLNENKATADDEALRQQVVTRLEKEKADKLYSEKEAKLQELSEQYTDGLDNIAEALALDVQHTDWLVVENNEGLLSSEKVREAALADSVMKEGTNSLPFVDNNKAMIVRIDEYEPVRLLTLEEADDMIKARLKTVKLQKEAEAKAESLKAAVNVSSEAFKEKAAELNLDYYTYNDVMISKITELEGLDDFKILAIISAFKAPVPKENEKSVHTEMLENDMAVSAVSRVIPGSLEDYSQEEKTLRKERLKAELSESELAAFIQSLKAASKIEFYKNNTYMTE